MPNCHDWRSYSLKELAAQYDNRAAVPEHQAIFKSWEVRSRAAREKLNCLLDLPYGSDQRQTLDIFHDGTGGKAALHIFLHGGYWQAMSKDYFSFVAEEFVRRGVKVAVPNYRLCPSVRVPQIVDDVRRAVLWLFSNAERLAIDTNRVQVSGHSAGGHLVAMLWSTDWSKGPQRLPENPFTSSIAVSGLFDLEPIASTPVNAALLMTSEEARELSPVNMVPTLSSPLALAVGEKESSEYHRQSLMLQERWRQHGTQLEIREITGCDHFSVLDELSREGGTLLELAAGLMEL